MTELAQKYKKTEAQIFYRYLSHSGIVPLIGSTSKKHLQEDLSIFEFELTYPEIQKISASFPNL
jgi:diketogulonate reductase-like aldo/keto reductase